MDKEIKIYNNNNRSPIKNLVYTFLHWFSVVLLSAISFIVQYSFMIDTGESYSSFLFAKRIYSINFLVYPIGVALFLIGYYIMWKKYLVMDWNGFKEQFWLWKIAYVMLALVALVAICVVGFMVKLCYLGLTGDIRPTWATWGFAVFPVYIVGVAIIDLCKQKKICYLST